MMDYFYVYRLHLRYMLVIIFEILSEFSDLIIEVEKIGDFGGNNVVSCDCEIVSDYIGVIFIFEFEEIAAVVEVLCMDVCSEVTEMVDLDEHNMV